VKVALVRALDMRSVQPPTPRGPPRRKEFGDPPFGLGMIAPAVPRPIGMVDGLLHVDDDQGGISLACPLSCLALAFESKK
jgi:hypothetical protein